MAGMTLEVVPTRTCLIRRGRCGGAQSGVLPSTPGRALGVYCNHSSTLPLFECCTTARPYSRPDQTNFHLLSDLQPCCLFITDSSLFQAGLAPFCCCRCLALLFFPRSVFSSPSAFLSSLPPSPLILAHPYPLLLPPNSLTPFSRATLDFSPFRGVERLHSSLGLISSHRPIERAGFVLNQTLGRLTSHTTDLEATRWPYLVQHHRRIGLFC